MIKSLRKRHLQIWVLWAILLPVGIIVAWMAVPKKVTQELLQQGTLKNTNVILGSAENENCKISILLDRAEKENSIRLEFINKKESVNPSLLIYWAAESTVNHNAKQELLGRTEGKGPFYFALSYLEVHSPWKISYTRKFILYDIRKSQAIDSITLKTFLEGIAL